MTKILTIRDILHYLLFVAAGDNLPSDYNHSVHRCVCSSMRLFASVLVFVRKMDSICVNRAPLFLYLYEIQKNLEEHGAPVVKSS